MWRAAATGIGVLTDRRKGPRLGQEYRREDIWRQLPADHESSSVADGVDMAIQSILMSKSAATLI